MTDGTNYTYATKTASYTLTVGKAGTPTAPTKKDSTYNGNAQALANAGSTAVTWYYKVGTALTSSNYSTTGSTTIPTATNAGSYDVYYYTPGNGNYNASAGSLKVTSTIAKAAGSISYATTSVSKTFGNAAFTNALTKTGDGTVTYTSSDTNVATVNSSTGAVTIVGAGSATITATVADGTNYTYATKTASYTLTVNKANISGSVTITGTNTYGQKLTATVSGLTPADSSLSYQWYYNDENSTTGGTAIEGATNKDYIVGTGMAGKYIYVVVTASKANYNNATFTDSTDAENNTTATVEKATRTMTMDETKTLTYGTDGTLTFSYNVEDVTVASSNVVSSNTSVATVSVTDGNLGGTVTIHPLKQGTTNVTVTVPASTNYKAISKTCVVTVNRANGNITLSKTNDAVVYGTTSRTFTVSSHHGGALTVAETTSTVAEVAISGTTVTVSNISTLPKDTVIKVRVTSGQTDQYNAAYADYTLTIGNALMTGSVSITGTPKYLETLTANTTGVSPSADSYTYQWWYADSSSATSGTNIDGATGSTYTINDASLVGKYIGVTVVATKANYSNATFTATTGPVTRIQIASNAEPKATNKTYNGASQTGVASGTGYTVTNGAKIDAGSYTATATLQAGYEWSNGSTDAKTINWSISAKSVAVTWGTTLSFAYDGTPKAPTAEATSGVTGETLVISRTTFTEAGTHTSVASIDSVTGGQAKAGNYTLTGSSKEFTITKIGLTKPTLSGTYTYTGSELTATLNHVVADKMIVTNNKRTNAGTYSGVNAITITLKDTTNCQWTDGTTEPVRIAWTIGKAAGSINYATKAVSKTYGDANFTNTLTKIGDGSVSYASNNTEVATVNVTTGEVTIIGAGSATITATVEDGANYAYEPNTASYTLTVGKAIGSIEYATKSIAKTYGDTAFTNELSKTGDGSEAMLQAIRK